MTLSCKIEVSVQESGDQIGRNISSKSSLPSLPSTFQHGTCGQAATATSRLNENQMYLRISHGNV